MEYVVKGLAIIGLLIVLGLIIWGMVVATPHVKSRLSGVAVEAKTLLWLPIISGILILLFMIWSPMDHTRAFAVGVIALLVMAAFYAKWDKVFPDHTGKKTVHILLVTGVVVVCSIIMVPNELWHRYLGFSPEKFFTVTSSEKAAEKGRQLLEAMEDKKIETKIAEINKKISTGKTPSHSEQVLLREYIKSDTVKFFIVPPDDYVAISKEGYTVDWSRLDKRLCIQPRINRDLPPVCPDGKKINGVNAEEFGKRSGKGDLELRSLEKEEQFVKAVYKKV